MQGGILHIYKPVGVTSHALVERIRSIIKLKVGHTGTLDPFARGNMLLCWGKGTRFTSFFQELPKTYHAWIRFGIATDSYDVQGQFCSFSDQTIDIDTLINVLSSYRGKKIQTIPPFSATKFQGRRLYQYARKGEKTPTLKKEITIYDLEVIQVQSGSYPEVEVGITCSSGTYIRSLAHEIGEQLGIGGYVYSLRREEIGRFSWLESIDVSDPFLSRDTLLQRSIPIDRALYWVPSVRLNDEEAFKLRQGNFIPLNESLFSEKNQRIKVYNHNGFIGVARLNRERGILCPEIILIEDNHGIE